MRLEEIRLRTQDSRLKSQDLHAGGGRGECGCHSPQCRMSFSIKSDCGDSMKDTTFISPPHLGQANGSTS